MDSDCYCWRCCEYSNRIQLYIICRYIAKSATIIYILSLAIADIAFLNVVVPLTLVDITSNDPELFEGAGRHFVEFFQTITVHVTCLTLMVMTTDRYLAIVYPVKSLKWRTTKTSLKVSIGVWIVSAVLSMPVAHSYISYISKVLVVMGLFLTTYGIPLLIISIRYLKIIFVLYKRNKEMLQKTGGTRTTKKTRRAVKMVALLILLFAFSWGPIQVLIMWWTFYPNFTNYSELLKVDIFAKTLSYANSCVNPFVYAFMNKKIRKALATKLKFKHGCV
ncbi:G-protein coupled receptor 54-like isoform X3 [Saccostrea cucullata]|uniref:G-protein coupled receptor 54-like isoform X3 n=1 Tax=Saccostrea cuccullata TaxID=36930 RepID=UPI002ED4EAE6